MVLFSHEYHVCSDLDCTFDLLPDVDAINHDYRRVQKNTYAHTQNKTIVQNKFGLVTAAWNRHTTE